MAEPLKNIYNEVFFKRFTKSIEQVFPTFNPSLFLKDIYNSEWDNFELKQRMRHITSVLKQHLTNDYETNIDLIISFIPVLIKNGVKPNNLEFIFFPDFIELYGINNYNKSIIAIEQVTQFVSCEFAVRPFLIEYQDKMMKQMSIWSNHENYMVRRLASEGCRPRLPWAMALPKLKKDPSSILPILENLKNDEYEYVRRSVANNLNDIAKDNPNTVIKTAKNWIGITNQLDKLVKHASRTLLKQGNTEVMELFGFGTVDKIQIEDLQSSTPIVKVGDYFEFSFKLINKNLSNSKIRLEYAIYYQKANGSLARKVFKISEKEYASNSTSLINKKQSFKIITTRKFHVGQHQVSIIVNGYELDKIDFELKN